MTLDRGRAGEPVIWDVLVHNLNARGPGDGQEPYLSEKVTADTLVLEDGALIFTNQTGGLVKAYGPSGWLEVTRA